MSRIYTQGRTWSWTEKGHLFPKTGQKEECSSTDWAGLRQGAKGTHETKRWLISQGSKRKAALRVRGAVQALRGAMKGWDGGSEEWEMQRGKDMERRYEIARRHCWSTQQTRVLTSTCAFTGTFHKQHENREGRRKDSGSLIEGWALQGSCGAKGSRSLGRKWLQGDTVGSRRGRSKA